MKPQINKRIPQIEINNNNQSIGDVLITIPVYNESRYVNDIINEVSKYHKNILVIDDGSEDGTDKLLKGHDFISVITHPINEGYGQSLIDAFEFAKGRGYKWVITMDCDYQHQPCCIPNFFEHMAKNDSDIMSGSRYLLAENTKDVPIDRFRINRRITSLLNLTLNIDITDAFCGFKAYRVSALNKLKLTVKGYGLPLQVWIQAAFSKFRTTEIPVPLIYHDPKRNFDGRLEVPKYRMQYYMNIIEKELAKHGYKKIEKLTYF